MTLVIAAWRFLVATKERPTETAIRWRHAKTCRMEGEAADGSLDTETVALSSHGGTTKSNAGSRPIPMAQEFKN